MPSFGIAQKFRSNKEFMYLKIDNTELISHNFVPI